MSDRVLFVDDDGAILNAIYRNLSVHLDITTAHSAEDGLALLRGPGRFSAVVTDIAMPGMGGLDFIERATEVCPDTKVIVLSGCNDPDLLARAAAKSAVAHVLTKPVDLEALQGTIEDAVRLAHAVAL